MAVAVLSEMRAHLSLTDDVGTEDDALIARLMQAAEGHVERLLGYEIEDVFGGADQEPVPPALVQAIYQLTAWWYDQRETAVTGTSVNEVPFGVQEIVREYREYSF